MAQHILIFGLHSYRCLISPAKTFLFGPLGRCRFTPSCSLYALQAIQIHGALAGSALAFRRLARCHPWGGCGPDPVPSKRPARSTEQPVALPSDLGSSLASPRSSGAGSR